MTDMMKQSHRPSRGIFDRTTYENFSRRCPDCAISRVYACEVRYRIIVIIIITIIITIIIIIIIVEPELVGSLHARESGKDWCGSPIADMHCCVGTTMKYQSAHDHEIIGVKREPAPAHDTTVLQQRRMTIKAINFNISQT